MFISSQVDILKFSSLRELNANSMSIKVANKLLDMKIYFVDKCKLKYTSSEALRVTSLL
jgi:hypothetical protein